MSQQARLSTGVVGGVGVGRGVFLGTCNWDKWMRNKSVTSHSRPNAAASDLRHEY